MTIQPIVEGHGEVEAVPVLVRRLLAEMERFDVSVRPPILRRRTDFDQKERLQLAVQLALCQSGCSAILVIFDADDEPCPKDAAQRVLAWAKEIAGNIACEVVVPTREFEAWFLAALESLRGVRGIREDAHADPSPECCRSAKDRITALMKGTRSYSPKTDQAALTAKMDCAAVYACCRSFRRMISALAGLLWANDVCLATCPTNSWMHPVFSAWRSRRT